MADGGQWDRHSLLQGGSVVAGAAVAAPPRGGTATAPPGAGRAEALFRAGKFEQAGRAYEEVLRTDPANAHAARRRGLVGLLANKFPDAEKYLTMAVELAPEDKDANELLADCYLRQDKFSLAAPRWRAAGEDAWATWFAAVRGEPYQLHGDTGRARITTMDPTPQVEASVNGGPAKRFSFYTGAPNLALSSTVAKEAGLSPVASKKITFKGGDAWAYYGVLESFALGGIELRNIPVSWTTTESGDDVDRDNDGMIGTWVFYHLLTTFDYAGRSLILRRPTPDAARNVRADAIRAGAEPLPLWLARDHALHSTGSIAGSGTRVMGVNLGGTGQIAAVVFGDTAQRLRIRADYDRSIETFAQSTPVVAYPCYPERIRLGIATARDIYCYTHPGAKLDPSGFDVPASLFHCFWKPYNVTLDFTDMRLYLARGEAA